jgi:hypothetical protein
MARLDGRAVGMERAFHEPRVALGLRPERNDACDARLLRAAFEPRAGRTCANGDLHMDPWNEVRDPAYIFRLNNCSGNDDPCRVL